MVAYSTKHYRENRERIIVERRAYRRKHPEKKIYQEAKSRAKKYKLPFNIDKEDIIVPTHCPILGMKLEVGGATRDNSPSIDKIIPSLGYVKGNIIIVSLKANRCKNNCTIEELIKVAKYYEELINEI